MKRKLFRTGLLGLICAGLLSASAFAMSAGVGTVNASALNLRTEADMGAAVVTTLPRGTTLVLSDGAAADGWVKVWYRGTVGYVSAEFLTLSDSAEFAVGGGRMLVSGVNMRSGPGTEYGVLTSLNEGTQMTVIGVSGSWYKVSVNGLVGYVRSDFVGLTVSSVTTTAAAAPVPAEPVVPAAPAAPAEPEQSADLALGALGFEEELPAPVVTAESTAAGNRIVETGRQYLGVPYVWAGTSPSGFDCSGFVYYVFHECGYSTNRTAESLYTNGVAVDRENLIPGDIICFTNGSGSYIGHVGIYIGDGKFIHASSGSGCVIISSLSENYYTSHYYGARRIAG